MYKKLIILFLAAVSLASCDKVKQKTPCGNQICTDLFAIVGIHYVDNTGNPIAVDSFKVFNVTSNKRLYPGIANINTVQGYYVVASDGNKMDYSTEGDVIKVSGTDPTTKETKEVNLKISGDCNCHVARLSGPDTVKFD
jgi:hypothetical protein